MTVPNPVQITHDNKQNAASTTAITEVCHITPPPTVV